MSTKVEGSKDTSVRIERVINPTGSCAGAGSDEFHKYRRARRTEMQRLEAMEKSAAEEALDAEFRNRVEKKRKECEERTAKNAEKRRKKKEKAKLKKMNAFANDGSFLEQMKAMTSAPSSSVQSSTSLQKQYYEPRKNTSQSSAAEEQR